MYTNRQSRIYTIIDRRTGEVIHRFRNRDNVSYFIKNSLGVNPNDVYNGNSRFIIIEDIHEIPLSKHESESNRIMKKRNSSLDDLIGSK